MDQIKIGKFIAECRKELDLTQVELAERLGVSDRAVSNWENGKNMPDLSLFKDLCSELNISINDLLSGEKLDKEVYQEKFEENVVTTIDYSIKKINKNDNFIGFMSLFFGIAIMFVVVFVLSVDRVTSFIGVIFGASLATYGFYQFIKYLEKVKKVLLILTFYLLMAISVMYIENLNPTNNYPNNQIGHINFNAPLKNSKADIENIIKYKSKYIGNNTNLINLINNLPLSEYGFVIEIDSNNFGVTINYFVADWYINGNNYAEKALVYNSVALFSLIDNAEYINFNFSGSSYKVTKKIMMEKYPNYNEIVKDNKIDKDNFKKYLADKLNEDDFIHDTYTSIFQQK